MRRFTIKILSVLSFVLLAACNNQREEGPSTDSIKDAIPGEVKTGENGTKVEGRFVSIKKLTDKVYALSLQVSKDSIAVFETWMPLDENEIRLLRKEGNNIKLTYTEYPGLSGRVSVRVVQSMEPVYGDRPGSRNE